MLKLSIQLDSNRVIAGINKDLDQTVRLVSRDLFTTVKSKTPIRSGRAKRGWTLKQKKPRRYEIANKVPYIERLDNGYSKQAPNGMTRPAIREVANKRIRRFTKR